MQNAKHTWVSCAVYKYQQSALQSRSLCTMLNCRWHRYGMHSIKLEAIPRQRTSHRDWRLMRLWRHAHGSESWAAKLKQILGNLKQDKFYFIKLSMLLRRSSQLLYTVAGLPSAWSFFPVRTSTSVKPFMSFRFVASLADISTTSHGAGGLHHCAVQQAGQVSSWWRLPCLLLQMIILERHSRKS